MKAIAANNKTSNKTIFVMLVFLILSCARMFGQEIKAEPSIAVLTNAVASAENTEAEMELVTWLMGVKQSQVSESINTSTISTNKTGKKQFINNGLTTNRILSRTFLKKIANHDSTVA